MHILLVRFLGTLGKVCGEASVQNALIIEWILCEFKRREVDANYILIQSIELIGGYEMGECGSYRINYFTFI